MFQAGDRIKVDKAGKQIIAQIIDFEFRAGTYVAKVKREDTGKEDVFAWNIYQDGISVHAMPPAETVTIGRAEFDRQIAIARAEGYNEGWEAAKSIWCEI